MNLARQLAAYCTANPEETSKLVEVAIGYLLEQASPENLQAVAALMPGEGPGASLALSLRILAEDRRTAPFSLGGK
jgi:hypothetical protein